MINQKILVQGLEELASKDLQQKLWVHGDDNEMSSFTEAICGVFDDAGISRAIESGYLRKTYSDELFRKIQELDRLIDLIPEHANPEDIIEHPKMHDVRVLSAALLALVESEMGP